MFFFQLCENAGVPSVSTKKSLSPTRPTSKTSPVSASVMVSACSS